MDDKKIEILGTHNSYFKVEGEINVKVYKKNSLE